MTQLSTNCLESLLVATTMSIKDKGGTAAMKHLDRVLRRHDRKGELRAGLLGLKPIEFRAMQKHSALEDIIKQRGFKERRDFCLALIGKLRSELLYRGWSRQRIEQYLGSKVALAA